MHPIDERFKALYDAEATPPEEVRAAIGHRLGWNKPGASGPSFPSMLLLLVGVAGAAFAWFHWSDNTISTTQEVAEVHEQHERTITGPTASYSQATTGQAVVAPAPLNRTESGGVDQTRSVSAKSEGSNTKANEGAPTTNGTTPSRSVAVANNKEKTLPPTYGHEQSAGVANAVNRRASDPNDRKKESSAVAARTQLVKSEAGSSKEGPFTGSTVSQPRSTEPVTVGSNDGITREIVAGANELGRTSYPEEKISTGAWIAPAMRVDLMQPRLTLLESESMEKQPINAHRVEDYVTPNGNWWVSIYGGLSSVNGKWSGTDAEALDRSEQWKSGWQAGAMAGRSWRSGIGVGIGAGIARIHSTFMDERSSITGEATDLDTAWATSNYPGTEIAISTWFIDTTYTPLIGPRERTTANNQYTAIQVPLSLWWHKDVKRWKLGATAGVMGWIPMKRQGLTLVRPTSDAEPAPAALSSPAIEPRYGMQLHGSAGLSLGYMLCEHLTILAEPMLSTPLYTGNENTSLSLSRPTIQLRLQYDIHSRIQRSK